MKRQSLEDFQGSETILYNTIMMNIYHNTFIQTHKMYNYQECTLSLSLYIYIMEYYSAIKKDEKMSFAATWMQLEIIILSEVSQKQKDKYYMILLICGI